MIQRMALDVKGLARKCVSVFMTLFLLIVMLLDIGAELNTLAHAIDDIGIAVLSFLMLLYIAIVRKDTSLRSFATQRIAIVIFILLMITFQIYGIFAELGTGDFGDEIPVIIGLILMLLNDFV